jgi:hypothetical protein
LQAIQRLSSLCSLCLLIVAERAFAADKCLCKLCDDPGTQRVPGAWERCAAADGALLRILVGAALRWAVRPIPPV